MRVVVTGGAGFIGSHLVEAFLAQGHETIVLDDLSSGAEWNIPGAADLVRCDISQPRTVTLIETISPRIVIHAAAQPSVARSMADPVRDRAVNLVGTEHVSGGARRAGAARIVFISSGGAIYGDAEGADEDDPPFPASHYGIHKWAAERYVMLSGLSYAVARPSNVYGPRQRSDLEGGVISIFAEAAMDGKPVTVHGSGEQSRDFVHVTDVAEAILRMAESDRNGIWNVGTGVSTSVNDLLTIVESLAGTVLARAHGPARPGDIRVSRLKIDRIANDLGWRPAISLEAGLRTLLRPAAASNSRA